MTSPDLYNNYEHWKRWDQSNFFKVDRSEEKYLSKEIGRYQLNGKKLLELGFGNATKLAWAAQRGAIVFGTEINDKMCKRASSAGIEVLPADFCILKCEYRDNFDIIIAYDVFEHLSIEHVREALVAVSEMLHKDGVLIARFPNGRSPLGRTYQHADHTHRSVLSDAIIEQLSKDLNMSLKCRGSGDYIFMPTSLKIFTSNVKSIVRLLSGRFIQTLYDIDTPICSNIIVHLQKG